MGVNLEDTEWSFLVCKNAPTRKEWTSWQGYLEIILTQCLCFFCKPTDPPQRPPPGFQGGKKGSASLEHDVNEMQAL